jgi:predicted phage tail protein/uncharacterized coiled-coil protein SlyX
LKKVKDEVLVIQGSGGGSGKKQHTPVEEPNTLRSKVRARILDLVAYGPIKGLVNGLRSVYLDGTPVENADGTLNFQGITVTTREGYPDQTYIPGFRSVENTSEVNTEIKQATPVIRSMTNNDADAAAVTIQLASLYKQEENGDTVGTTVEVFIDVRKDGGAWQQAVAYTFQGKTTAPYPKTFRIDLKPYGKGSFDLRVRRNSKESETSKLADKMTWTLLTEIIDRRFSHPNMALVGIEVDSELFGAQMPARVYHMDLSITQVPSNWDPYTRAYTGIWDGTFKDSWHDNPAWAYYDLAMHPVIGAGLDVIDKWELYRIAQFCDELVPNGYGGMEPRFTINTVFADQEDATVALNTLATIFRGMTYWGSNTVVPVADMPENPVLTVGPSSVKDGDFARTGTSMRERHSVAIVMWNDPDDMGKAVPEIYEDPDSLAEFGWRETRVTAVACNSRGQARRMAMWILDSERYETQTLSYTGTTEHAFLRPGNIIEVADPFEQGARMSGRLLERSTNQVTVDKVPAEAVAQVGGQWWLSVMLPDLTLSRHRVSSFDGDVVHLVDPLLTLPVVGAIWGLYSAGLQLPHYRVVSNAEDSETGMFQVTATEYDINKYSRVEQGLILPERPISLLPNGPLPAPTNLEFKVYTYYAGTARQQGLLISFEPPSDVRIDSFVIDVKSPSDASYRTVYNGPGTSFDMTNAEAGQWTVRVRSTASTGKLSQWTARTVQISQLLLPTPPDSVNVAVATFSVTLTPLSAYTDAMWEFWRSLVPLTAQQIEANAQQLPTGQYLVDADLKPDTQYYYYVRGVNQYGKSNWFGVQAKTLNNFDDILEAVTEDIKEGILYQYFEEKIDTKAAQVAIDKANEVVNGALTEVNQSIADLNATVDQVGSTVTTGLADANTAIQAVKTQADGIRADLNTNVSSVSGTLQSILGNVSTLQSETNTLKTSMTSVQGSITTINTTTGTLRADLTALQTDVSTQVGTLQGLTGGLRTDLSALQSSVSTQVSGLQAQLDAASSAREYNKGNAYTAGQFISVGRSLYQAKIAVPAKADGTNAPPNATYWRDAGSVVASADGLAARVTTAETNIGTINGTLTSQATTISGLQTTLNGKADSSALTALTSRVTAAENTITSQGSAITSLTNTVAGKADASAVTALTTRVTAAEGTLTSLSNSLTTVQATLGNIAGNGSNLVPSEYSWLSAAVPTIAMSPVTPVVSEADATVPSGYRYKITRGNASNPWTMFCKTNNAAGWNTTLTAGTYIVSFYANTNAAGVTNGLKARSAVWDGTSRGTTDFTVTAARTRYSHLVTLAADTVGALTIFLPTGAVGDLLWVDSLMIERQIANGTTPSAFVAGPTGSEITGLATAQTALEARVTSAEGVNTSQATSITNLNSSLAGKADASALTALTTRVTAAEGVNTSQGDSITSLTNTVNGKADASALTALTTRVTAAEGSISSQGSAITNLTNSLAGKADAAALTALTTRVTSAEGTLTSLGNSLTSVQATLGGISGNGTNMLPAEYCVFGATAPAMVVGGGITAEVEADATAFSGYALKFQKNSGTATVYLSPSTVFGSANMVLKKKKYLVSMYARAGTAGHQFRAGFRAIQADGTVVFHYPSNMTVTTEWARYTTVIDMTASPADKMILCIDAKSGTGAYGVPVWVDKIMVEEQIGTGTEPSAFVMGNSAGQVTGLAAAQTALEARVTAAEGVNTSQATSITNLNSSLAGKADASALTALTTRVTAAEGVNTSQGESITSLTNSLGSKADASALTALTTRVTAAEGVNTSQGTAITNLTNSLTGKADVSALNALTTRVSAAEGSIISQGNSLTSVQATLGNIGGNGTNLLPTEWSWLTSLNAPPLPKGAAVNLSMVAIAEADSGFGVKSDTVNGGSVTNSFYMYSPANNAGGRNIRIEPGTYLVSMYVKASAAATVRVSLYDGTHRYSADQTSSTTRTRMTFPVTVTDSARISVTVYPNRTMLNDISTEIDSVMIERRIGESNTPSPFVAGPTGSEVATLASAQTALEARVTAAEGVNTSQATSITNLNSSLAGKADASALTALTTRVTAAEGVNTSQGSAITSLTNSVAGKADVSALNALTTRVTAAEGTLTALSSSVTTVQATLGNIAGSGVNLLPSEYSWLTSTTLPTMTSSLSNRSGVAVAGSPSGFGYYLQATSNSLFSYMVMAPSNAVANYNLSLEAGTYLVSMYVKGDTAGQVMANLYDGTNSRSATLAYTTARQRLTFVITLPAAAKSALLIYPNRQGAATAGITVDSIMIESRVGENNTPSTFVPGPSASEVAGVASATTALEARVTAAEGVNTSQATSITNLNSSLAGKADASALTALTTRVTNAEGVNTSQGSAITSLTAGVGNTSQEDVLLNPTWAAEGSLKTENGSVYQMDYANATDAGVPAGAPAGRLLWRLKKAADSGWGGTVLNSAYAIGGTNQIYSRANAGDVINLSCHMFCENTAANAGKIAITPVDADGNSGGVGNIRILGYDAATGGWQFLTAQYTIPAGYAGFRIYVVPEGVAPVGFKMWLANLKVTRQTAGEKTLASAQQALDTRVTAAEGTITSQGSSITNLSNSLANKADASALTALTTRVTAAEGVNTSQGTSITNLTNSLAGKADASALTALTTRVTAAEGAITSQGNSITTLTSMIGQQPDNLILKGTFEDGDIGPWTASPLIANVTAHASYSKAIQFMANSFCGTTRNVITRGGEEFDCSADVWNNYMTAGQTTRLQIQFYDKADTSLGYFTAFTVYAGANGFQTYSGRITAPAGSVTARFVVRHETSDGTGRSLWCNIQARRVSMADSANAAATSALTTRVTSAEGSLTSQGSSITNLTNSMNAIAGSGSNLLPAEYSAFSATGPVTSTNAAYSVAVEADAAAFNGYALKLTTNNTTNSTMYFVPSAAATVVYGHANIGFKRGKYIVSYYAKANVAGHTIAPFLKSIAVGNANVNSNIANQNQALTTDWARYSAVIDMTSASHVGDLMMLCMQLNVSVTSGRIVWIDKVMIEPAVGGGTEPSAFVPGNSVRQVMLNAAATQALDTRLTAAEGVNTSQATSITSLNSSLAGKADNSALTALTTRVTAAEGSITSQGSSITALSSTLGGISGNGANLLPSQYSWLTSAVAPQMAVSATTIAGVAVAGSVSGFGFTATSTSASTGCYAELAPSNNAAGWNIWMEPGTYLVSFYASAPSAASVRVSMYDGAQRYSPTFTLNATRTRYSGVVTVTAATKAGLVLFYNMGGVSGTVVTFDSVMIERQIAGGTVPSSFVAGPSASEVTGLATAQQALDTRVTAVEGVNTSQATSITNLNTSVASKADASALNALTTRVTTAENTITSQSGAITSLTSGLNGVSTDNLIIDPTYAVGNNTNQGTVTVLTRTAPTVTSIGCPAPRVLNWPVATSTGNTYMGINAVVNSRSPESALAHNMAVAEGETYDFELYVFSTVARQYGLWIQFYDTAGASINHTWAAEGGDGVRLSSTAGAWVKLTGTATVPAGVIRMAMCLRFSAGDATTAQICSPVCRKRDGQTNGQASAIQNLDTRVTAAEGVNTSQASSITSLTSTVAGKADTSALNSLTTRVTAAEGSISSQGSAVTALQTSLGNIGGTGSNLNPSEYSVFGPNPPTIGALSSGLTASTVADSATLGGYALKFVSSNTTTTLACYLHASNTVAAVGSFPMAYSPGKYILSFYAKANVAGRTIKAWLRALNSADAVVAPTAPTFTLTTGWVRYSAIMDLSNATTYSGSRMVFAVTPNNSGVSGTEVYLDRIMVEQQIGSNATPSAFDGGTSYTQAQAQASAINSLDTRLTSAEGVNTSQASSITSLTSRVGSAEASISTTASTLASTNGTLSSMWAMKMTQTSNGINYVAGMGVSLVTDANSGIAQAAIAFQADRFALLNVANNSVTVPFFVENGVTYIQQAMIKAATITNLIVGTELSSAAQTNWGGPVMQVNFNIGQVVTRHPTSAWTYTVMDRNGVVVVVNGVVRVRMGVW